MEVLYFLIPLSIMMGILALVAFIWAIKTDQLGDIERHSEEWLFDSKLKKD